MHDDALSRVRRTCLALPEASEQEAWGEPTFRVKKKIFAMFASAANHHGGGDDALWCKASVGVQEILVRSDPGTYFSPPYVGVNGWIGIRLGSIDDATLREHVVESYCLVAPKKLQALLVEEPPPS
jgi:hypothetical protein